MTRTGAEPERSGYLAADIPAAEATTAAGAAAARTDVSEEVKYYSKLHRRARRRPFLKFFMLNQFKLHPMLGVRQRSRLVTEEGGENASCGH